MAINRQYTQVDPINLETDVAIGVPFPFNAEGVFYSTYTTKEQVKSNLLNVLLTEPGERLFNPLFGVGIRNLLFEQGIDLEKLKSRINIQVELFVPEITITNVVVNKAQHSHVLFIKLSYKLNINNDTDSIQLNFNESVE
jgi:phage baseplate assembly protein W|tara:strand:+ start:19 stop:438 length:420 start_codon:yes stop_codon:yes gene_type:complete